MDYSHQNMASPGYQPRRATPTHKNNARHCTGGVHKPSYSPVSGNTGTHFQLFQGLCMRMPTPAAGGTRRDRHMVEKQGIITILPLQASRPGGGRETPNGLNRGHSPGRESPSRREPAIRHQFCIATTDGVGSWLLALPFSRNNKYRAIAFPSLPALLPGQHPSRPRTRLSPKNHT